MVAKKNMFLKHELFANGFIEKRQNPLTNVLFPKKKFTLYGICLQAVYILFINLFFLKFQNKKTSPAKTYTNIPSCICNSSS